MERSMSHMADGGVDMMSMRLIVTRPTSGNSHNHGDE